MHSFRLAITCAIRFLGTANSSPTKRDSSSNNQTQYGLPTNDTSEANYGWDTPTKLNDTHVLGFNGSQPPDLDSFWNHPILDIDYGDPQLNSSGFPMLNSSGQPQLDNSSATLDDASGQPGTPVSHGRVLLGANDYPGDPSHQYKRIVAIGDSYSAGPNAGDHIVDSPPDCYQTDGGWPVQLNQSMNHGAQFQFSACTGATTQDILQQVQATNFGDPDLVTVTMGGNNNGAFANVIKQCVVIPSLSSTGCNAAIANARNTIRNINGDLVDVLNAISAKQASGSRDILVVGYPRLFSATWPRVLNCYTSQIRRTQLNDLVDSMNQELASAVREQRTANIVEGHHNNVDVLFVDPNEPISGEKTPPSNLSFDTHRFCELTNLAYFQFGGLGSLSVDFTSAFLKGIFHPTWNGFTVMAEAAQYRLSQKYPGV